MEIIRLADRVEYREDGSLHRLDGPAVIYNSGLSYWYRKGKLHRDGGPAVTWCDGDDSWYKDGNLHREDGPAVDWERCQDWYLNGVRIDKNIFLKKLLEYKYNLKLEKTFTKSRQAIEYLYDEEERRKLERLT